MHGFNSKIALRLPRFLIAELIPTTATGLQRIPLERRNPSMLRRCLSVIIRLVLLGLAALIVLPLIAPLVSR